MPDPRFRLSVLKLDNTSFEVRIAKTATVLGLKLAVENVFWNCADTGGGNISWSHVWSHFCLCYKQYKLIDDRKHLKDYGIKDSDQLHFIRHLSFDQSASKRRQKHHEALVAHHKATVEHHKAMVERNVMLLAGPEGLEECEKENKNAKDYDNSSRGLLAESEDLEELEDETTNAKSDDNDNRKLLAGLDGLELEEENKSCKNDNNASSSEYTNVQNEDEEEYMLLGHSQLKKVNLWSSLRYSRMGSLRKSRSEKSEKIRHWRSKSYF